MSIEKRRFTKSLYRRIENLFQMSNGPVNRIRELNDILTFVFFVCRNLMKQHEWQDLGYFDEATNSSK